MNKNAPLPFGMRRVPFVLQRFGYGIAAPSDGPAYENSRGKAAACHRLSSLTGTKLPGPRNRKRLVFLPALLSIGAEGESRTPTPLPELDPEPSVSTNSTTSARKSVYRIRPPAGKLFFRFFPFFYFNKQNRDDKRQHSQAPGDCCPPAGKGYAKLAALRTADEMAAVRGTAPQAGTGGVRPCAMTGSGHPAGAAFREIRWKRRDGGGQERMAPALPLRRQPIFRRLAARPRPEKRKEPTCAALPPSLPGPRFILSLPSGTGKTASLSAPSPGSSRCPGCSPSRAAAALATLSLISPAAATGTSGAWR